MNGLKLEVIIIASTNRMGNFLVQEIYITGVQLEVGKNATEFENRPYHEELALCQRYYQSVGSYVNNNWAPITIVIAYNGAKALTGSIPTPVTMRTHPTVTF